MSIPDYRPAEWRAKVLAASDDASVDAAMQWAYDLGIGAERAYVTLLGIDLAEIEAAEFGDG